MSSNTHTVIELITKKLATADNILIICSTPIDYDSVGTSLALKWWLNQNGKNGVEVITISHIQSYLSKIPQIEDIHEVHLSKINFGSYDMIFLVDGNSWRQFFTINYAEYIYSIPKDKIFNIDHHEPGEIEKYIPDNTIRVKDSCTAKVLFDSLIKPSGIKLDKTSATWMYYALVGDTGTFSYEIYKDTFSFAQQLIDLGVDHYKISEITVSEKMLDYTQWAMQNTKLYPEINSTMLVLDQKTKDKLVEKYGSEWESEDYGKYYQKIYMTLIEGYPYSLIFKSIKHEKITRVIWRTKNIDKTIEIAKVLQKAGFTANGHRNAGGGMIELGIEEAVERFVSVMKLTIKN